MSLYDRQYRDIFPTHTFFAFRLLACLNAVGGALSKSEFDEWFDFPEAHRALRRFRRLAFRVYVQMHIKKSVHQRLAGRPYRVRIRLMRRVKRRLCSAWKTERAYALYREVVVRGFDQKTFAAWWTTLNHTEQLLIVEAWTYQIKRSVKDLWYDGWGYWANIYVQLAEGEQSAVRIF